MKINTIRPTDEVIQLDSSRKIQQYRLELQKAQALNDQLARQVKDSSFGQMLKDKLKESEKGQLKISKHAQARADERGIELRPALIQDIKTAVDKAREKGIKDMVVIGKDGAFVVNVTNNVVVTSMDQMEMKHNVFTNIDGAVLI